MSLAAARNTAHAYAALGAELLGRPNDQSYLKMHLSPAPALGVLMALGIGRALLEVACGIRIEPKWYCLDADILFTLAWFPPHLCFFAALAMSGAARVCRERRVPHEGLVAFAFHAQVLHLMVAPVDRLGLWLGIPWQFSPWRAIAGPYFFSPIVMTAGIVVVWIATLRLCVRVLRRAFGAGRAVTAGVLLLAWPLIYLPIYHLWPAFDTTACRALARVGYHCRAPAHWGYGLYFAVTALVGMAGYVWSLRRRIHAASPPAAPGTG